MDRLVGVQGTMLMAVRPFFVVVWSVFFLAGSVFSGWCFPFLYAFYFQGCRKEGSYQVSRALSFFRREEL